MSLKLSQQSELQETKNKKTIIKNQKINNLVQENKKDLTKLKKQIPPKNKRDLIKNIDNIDFKDIDLWDYFKKVPNGSVKSDFGIPKEQIFGRQILRQKKAIWDFMEFFYLTNTTILFGWAPKWIEIKENSIHLDIEKFSKIFLIDWNINAEVLINAMDSSSLILDYFYCFLIKKRESREISREKNHKYFDFLDRYIKAKDIWIRLTNTKDAKTKDYIKRAWNIVNSIENSTELLVKKWKLPWLWKDKKEQEKNYQIRKYKKEKHWLYNSLDQLLKINNLLISHQRSIDYNKEWKVDFHDILKDFFTIEKNIEISFFKKIEKEKLKIETIELNPYGTFLWSDIQNLLQIFNNPQKNYKIKINKLNWKDHKYRMLYNQRYFRRIHDNPSFFESSDNLPVHESKSETITINPEKIFNKMINQESNFYDIFDAGDLA